MTAHRDALLEAVLVPPEGWPAWTAIDRPAFWARFRQAAPAHLRLGVLGATLVLGVLLPLVLAGRPLRRLAAPARERTVQRMAALPVAGLLFEVAKVVAALCYFDSSAACAAARAGRAP